MTTTVDAVSWGVRAVGDMDWLPGKNDVMKTVWALAGLNRDTGAALVLAAALSAIAVGAMPLVRR